MNPKSEIQMIIRDFPAKTTQFMSDIQKNPEFADVTLACDDYQLVPAHKMILSAGSTFFQAVLRKLGGSSQPLVYLRGVAREELEVILALLYTGQTRVSKQGLDSFLLLARDLGISGFTGQQEEEEDNMEQTNIVDTCEIEETSHAETLPSLKYEVEETIQGESCKQTLCDDGYEKDTFANAGVEAIQNNSSMNVDRFVLKHKSPNKLYNYTTDDLSQNKLRPNHSPVWMFAQKLDSTKCRCNFCGKVVPTRMSSTTHIRNHLLKDHSDIPEVARDIPIVKSKQQPIF